MGTYLDSVFNETCKIIKYNNNNNNNSMYKN